MVTFLIFESRFFSYIFSISTPRLTLASFLFGFYRFSTQAPNIRSLPAHGGGVAHQVRHTQRQKSEMEGATLRGSLVTPPH